MPDGDLEVRRARQAGHSLRSKDDLISEILLMDMPVLADQQRLIFVNFLRKKCSLEDILEVREKQREKQRERERDSGNSSCQCNLMMENLP